MGRLIQPREVSMKLTLTACASVVAIVTITQMAIGLAAPAAPMAGQWVNHPTRGLPRTADGKPDLSAPTPRTRDGQVDLSGIWLSERDPKGTSAASKASSRRSYMINIMADLKPGEVPFQPWAEALYKQRGANLFRDNPMIRCLLPVCRVWMPTPTRTRSFRRPSSSLSCTSRMTMFRQIFVDGRALPEDPEPSWLGYSVGKWDGDVMVVETAGFNDQTWLDGSGHPHSEAMRVTERFRRVNVGRMEIEIVIDDPKAYTKPLKIHAATDPAARHRVARIHLRRKRQADRRTLNIADCKLLIAN